jgi:hypothetical protein
VSRVSHTLSHCNFRATIFAFRFQTCSRADHELNDGAITHLEMKCVKMSEGILCCGKYSEFQSLSVRQIDVILFAHATIFAAQKMNPQMRQKMMEEIPRTCLNPPEGSRLISSGRLGCFSVLFLGGAPWQTLKFRSGVNSLLNMWAAVVEKELN